MKITHCFRAPSLSAATPTVTWHWRMRSHHAPLFRYLWLNSPRKVCRRYSAVVVQNNADPPHVFVLAGSPSERTVDSVTVNFCGRWDLTRKIRAGNKPESNGKGHRGPSFHSTSTATTTSIFIAAAAFVLDNKRGAAAVHRT